PGVGEDALTAIEPASAQPRDTVGRATKGAPDAAVQGGPLTRLPDLPGQKVIKNASIRVEIGDGKFQERYSQASLVAEQLGGFVTNSATFEREGRITSGTVAMRVPSDKFQSALAELRKLGEVKGEEQNGQDVTSEFVDLDARLRHLKSQEAFYLRLMDEAKTISDMIQIQQQLSSVQLQIEEVQGRLNFLKDQTTYSTITASIFEEGASTAPPKGLGKAWREALDGFKSVVSGLIVASGWVAPFALMAVVAWFVWRSVRSGRREPKAAAEFQESG
ncbi:MAG: DUF4349 domain-containing protein, partial [Acidimicrobiia bacterium]